jgi:micrococcal nuclease
MITGTGTAMRLRANGRYLVLALLIVLAGCSLEEATPTQEQATPVTGGSGDVGQVVRVVDGDTIIVRIGGREESVRYIGVNTPEIGRGGEADQPCAQDASAANFALVTGQTVRLERDVSERDIYDRLLRYVYVGDVFVNAELVRLGFAEAVSYPPDTREYNGFVALEQNAAAAGMGCHPTGIFDDGSYTR